MAKQEKINELVQTVRKLNWEIRPKLKRTPGGDPPGNPMHQALTELRNNEIQVSQTIRNLSLTELDIVVGEGNVVEHTAASEMGSRQLLSEFGTAREAILSLLRNFSDEDWEKIHSTQKGDVSINQLVDGLIASDKKYVERIVDAQ